MSSSARAFLLIGCLLALPACTRLNPDWCESIASCSANEYCDPQSNTCRPREAGAFDLSQNPAHDRGPGESMPPPADAGQHDQAALADRGVKMDQPRLTDGQLE
jgi:hypothetical protein